MKKNLLFLLIIFLNSACSHPDFKNDGGTRITMEASVGDLLKMFIQPEDSIAKATVSETYKEYSQKDQSFFNLYFAKLEKADPTAAVGKHFKTGSLSPAASADECKTFFEKNLSALMDKVILILSKRIEAFGIGGASIRKGEKPELLIIELPGKNDMERVRKLLQSSAKLEFWETDNNQHVFERLNELNASIAKELNPELADTAKETGIKKSASLDAQLSEIDEEKERLKMSNPLFTLLNPSVTKNGTDNMLSPGPVVGTAFSKDTAKINKYLNMPSSKKITGPYLKFLWTLKSVQSESGNVVSLIAIKMDRRGTAPLSGNIINSAHKTVDDQGQSAPLISVTMTQEAAATWAQLTRDNIGNSIAIVVDDQVYSYPIVQSEISGGQSSITGSFTDHEADDFVNVLNAGYLPIPVRIVEEELVSPAVKK